MLRPFALLALAALASSGCVTTASLPDERALVGRWDMESIIDDGTDVSAEANPAGDRYIDLRADGSFVSGGQPYGRNTGRWVYNPRTRRLGLDSDLGPDDDSVWSVTIRGDVMTWEGEGSDYARRFTITSRRAG